MTRSSIWAGSAAMAIAAVAVLPAASSAAVHARADTLVPVAFGLPAAKEGQTYSFSIAGAATGGTKPYRCTPASLDVGSLRLGANCVISGTAPDLPSSTTHRIVGPFVFKLTDSGHPPKTVTLHALNIEVTSKSEEFPFDGTWRGTLTVAGTISQCPNAPQVPAQHTPVELQVVHGVLRGHKLAVDVTGITGTVTEEVHLPNFPPIIEKTEFSVTGAVTRFHVTVAGGGPLAGCVFAWRGSGSGSRVSP
jgi:hypothetical protein